MTTLILGTPDDLSVVTGQAKRLRKSLEAHCKITHAQSLELVARMHGQESYGHLRAVLDQPQHPSRN